ncbi:MAG: hypothetical protein IBX55_19815 [Methyloprofundus sp.]|nr:hypothetical protein [Methyloprofundus sp.]
MKKYKSALILIKALALSILISGCASQISISAIQPAEVDRAATLKQVGVLPFNERDEARRRNHNVNLGSKIEAKLAAYQLDNSSYFTVVSRSDLDRIITEQKFQRSGLVDESRIAEIGRLAGAESLISGSVSSTSLNDSTYRATRYRSVGCDSQGKNCRRQEYTVPCRTRTISLGAQIRMIDVSRGDLVTAQSYNETMTRQACQDTNSTLPSLEQGIELLSDRVADDFIRKITPNRITFKVTLIEKLDVRLPKEHEEKFKSALAFLKAGRMDRSNQLLTELLHDSQQRSYAIAYNLGVIKEALADYDDAKSLYAIADSLTLKPVKEINLAVNRIDDLINQHQRAQNQIQQ